MKNYMCIRNEDRSVQCSRAIELERTKLAKDYKSHHPPRTSTARRWCVIGRPRPCYLIRIVSSEAVAEFGVRCRRQAGGRDGHQGAGSTDGAIVTNGNSSLHLKIHIHVFICRKTNNVLQ